MGIDIHIHIIKHKPNGGWESVKIYRKENEEFKVIDPYPRRNSELFSILSKEEDDDFPCSPICENDLPEDVLKELNEDREYCCFNFYEANLADIKLYLNNHSTVRDWDYNGVDEEDFKKNGWKDNPVKYLIERVISYLDMADYYWDFEPIYSNIKIVYWFDN